jgi:hypothetical protein
MGNGRANIEELVSAHDASLNPDNAAPLIAQLWAQVPESLPGRVILL